MAIGKLWTSSEDNLFEGKSSSISALGISVLFACGSIALAFIVTPMVADNPSSNKSFNNGAFDNVMTGSVDNTGKILRSKGAQPFPKDLNSQGSNAYTIRRSVTQTSNEACIIYNSGLKTVSCN